MMYYIKHEVIGDYATQIESGIHARYKKTHIKLSTYNALLFAALLNIADTFSLRLLGAFVIYLDFNHVIF